MYFKMQSESRDEGFKPVLPMEIEWGALVELLCLHSAAGVSGGRSPTLGQKASQWGAERAGEGKRLGAAFGSHDAMSTIFRSEHAGENGSNVLKQRPSAAPFARPALPGRESRRPGRSSVRSNE